MSTTTAYYSGICAHSTQMWMSVRKDWMTAVMRWPVASPRLALSCADQWLHVSTPMAATSAHVPLATREMGGTALVSCQFPCYEIVGVDITLRLQKGGC